MRAQLPREVALEDRADETLINREPENVRRRAPSRALADSRRLLPIPSLPPGHPPVGGAH